MLGDLTTEEVVARGGEPAWLVELEGQRRALRVRIAGEERWVAVEDAGRLRDALGAALPVGVAEAFLEPVKDPVGDLVSRYARTHGPFHPADVAARFGFGIAVVDGALARLATSGRVVHGEFRPGGTGLEWCDAEVLRSLRRRSLAKLRKEVEPVPPEALARFLPQWQGISVSGGRGMDALVRAVEQLQGAIVPASALETLVLPSRVPGYTPALLDELTASGEVLWAGQGSLPGNDGWVSLQLADSADLLLPRAARDVHHPAARRGARGARRRAGAVLPPAVRPGREPRRHRAADRAVGPGLGRPPHQRHARPAARAARHRADHPLAEAGAGPPALARSSFRAAR